MATETMTIRVCVPWWGKSYLLMALVVIWCVALFSGKQACKLIGSFADFLARKVTYLADK